MTDEPRVLTVDEAAVFLRLSIPVLVDLVERGVIPCLRLSPSTWRFARRALEAWDADGRPRKAVPTVTPGTARPRGASPSAVSRVVATAAGPLDVWTWRVRVHPAAWRGKVGGPEPSELVSAHTYSALMARLIEAARQTYGKPVRAVSLRTRFAVLQRDGFACRYCGRKPPEVELAVDHVVAIANGGTNDPDNLVAACTDCNLGKSDQ